MCIPNLMCQFALVCISTQGAIFYCMFTHSGYFFFFCEHRHLCMFMLCWIDVHVYRVLLGITFPEYNEFLSLWNAGNAGKLGKGGNVGNLRKGGNGW